MIKRQIYGRVNLVFACTGNPDPDSPLPDTPYSSGIIAVDAGNGTFHGFFQPTNAESYRPGDTDVDFGGSPTLYTQSGQDVVAFAGKNGAAFLLDPATMNKLAFRQLLPTFANGNPIPTVDVHQGPGENKSGVFGTPAVDPAWGHVYFGLGGYEGVDKPTTPFLRVCYWDSGTLADAWPVVLGADTITRYSTAQPPMYTTTEAGLSSPVVVNDVVFVSTSAPALYAFSSANGIPLWTAPGFPQNPANTFSLGPAVYGDYVLVGAGNELFVYRLQVTTNQITNHVSDEQTTLACGSRSAWVFAACDSGLIVTAGDWFQVRQALLGLLAPTARQPMGSPEPDGGGHLAGPACRDQAWVRQAQ